MEWASLIVGWAGVFLAGAAFLVGRRVGRGQLRAFRADEADPRFREARGVSAWVDMKAYDDEAYVVAARNGGDQPVYESVVYLQSPTSTT